MVEIIVLKAVDKTIVIEGGKKSVFYCLKGCLEPT